MASRHCSIQEHSLNKKQRNQIKHGMCKCTHTKALFTVAENSHIHILKDKD